MFHQPLSIYFGPFYWKNKAYLLTHLFIAKYSILPNELILREEINFGVIATTKTFGRSCNLRKCLLVKWIASYCSIVKIMLLMNSSHRR